ncbi:hypothetical protein GUJ93_ZPchr0013g37668 [Zizania palustris]|uniref:Uncharacterized protein n=1 Tax=Zizania palustris TaxID=103762 RepID=A0A8J6BZZ6_ZIZPA|nr:hypothetical protein GUJ93_ZPchr0013g36698 [Zizania palustris]KAG8098561.1 hypothetical protein GUJ93_ZPchr0013g37668 [Zizania palustris]
MPFQLKNGHPQHHGAMEGKPPAAMPQQQQPAPPRVSRFRRLLVRVSASERDKDEKASAGAGSEVEVGSVALDRMVLSFMEESAAVERPQRGRCNCFNGSNYEESDDDEDFFLPSNHSSALALAAAGDTLESLKGLVQSASVVERNLLADASRIAERCGKSNRGKAEGRRAVADGLRALGYDAAVCRSRWEKTSSYPAGEHEYIDAVVGEEVRLIVEVDFRSEFEVARSTKAYRAALQALPPLFVGTPDRLGQIVAVVADAARQSLKKKGLHFPPWRKPEYMRAKWLSPHVRCGDNVVVAPTVPATSVTATPVSAASFTGEFELLFDRMHSGEPAAAESGGEKITVVVSPWRPTEEAIKKPPVVTGLAAVL